MRVSYKQLTRVKDILEIDGHIISGAYSSYDEVIKEINLGHRELENRVIRFLRQQKNTIIDYLKQSKMLKVRSSVGVYSLFFADKLDTEKFYIVSPYFENHISVRDYNEIIYYQGIDIDDKILEVLYAIPVISKSKFNYLVELLCETETVDFLSEIEVLEDDSKSNYKKQNHVSEDKLEKLLDKSAAINSDLIDAVIQGDFTRMSMVFDIYIQKYGRPTYPVGEFTVKIKSNYLNDMLHAILSKTVIDKIEVDAMWTRIRNRIDNSDFTEHILKNYCLLVEKEKYKEKQPVVRACINYINEHLREKINLDDVAQVLEVNKSYLSSVFNREMGFSVVDYIHEKRTTNAEYLLKNTDFSIAEIADYVGYFDTSYFIRIFRTIKQITPLKYREQNKA